MSTFPYFSCDCPPDWTNADSFFCNNNPDLCGQGNTPCVAEQSQCLNTVSEPFYECECLPGYEGENCETDIDECQTLSPCLNFGTCQNELTPKNTPFYKCTCYDGFEGEHCESQFDPCSSGPCNKFGNCIPEFLEFTQDDIIRSGGPKPAEFTCECTRSMSGKFCQCGPGLTGAFCDVDIDECASDPCFTGGTCLNPATDLGVYKCEYIQPCGVTDHGSNTDVYWAARDTPTSFSEKRVFYTVVQNKNTFEPGYETPTGFGWTLNDNLDKQCRRHLIHKINTRWFS